MVGHLSDDSKAIILLCGVFGKTQTAPPLSQAEYNRVVRWLVGSKRRPRDLLDPGILSEASVGSTVALNRLEALLGRSMLLGFAVEEWERNGIWVLSRVDAKYPLRFKKLLKDQAPPLLYGVGDVSFLAGGGLAIAGSAEVDSRGREFIQKVTGWCAERQVTVVGGGGHGLDRVVMESSLEAGGMTIGIVSDNLLSKSVERSARTAIAEGRFLLVSPFHPQAGYSEEGVRASHQLVHPLVEFELVVSHESEIGKGSALREQLMETFSRLRLVRVYEVILPILLEHLKEPKTVDELSAALEVLPEQAAIWLNRAEGEKRVFKLSHPERYQKTGSEG